MACQHLNIVIYLHLLVFLFALPSVTAFPTCTVPRQAFHDGLCYKGCPPAFSGNGKFCIANVCKSIKPSSCEVAQQLRGPGTSPQPCSSISFARAGVKPAAGPFSLLIANDPQLVWWQDPSDGIKCMGEPSCKLRLASAEAAHQVRAMNALRSPHRWPNGSTTIAAPVGVIINGDLTQYFHPNELHLFESFYIASSNAPHKHVLQLPLFLGLGNHDYQINLDDCYWLEQSYYLLRFSNGCAQKAVDYVRAMVSCGAVEAFPSKQITRYDSGSLAYSWDIANYHFIQLHNYPTYTAETVGISSSMQWLKRDLALATAAKTHIIVNLHDLEDHFTSPDRDRFRKLLEAHNVVGIFCGHVISANNLGYQGLFGSIPVFRGGHGGELNRNKFLLVEFTATYYRVASISSVDGVPKFVNAGWDNQFDKTIRVK